MSENRELFQAVAELCAMLDERSSQSPPDDWQPYDSWNDRVGYDQDNRDSPCRVPDVDSSNYDDIAEHAAAVRDWSREKSIRPIVGRVKNLLAIARREDPS